MMPPWLTQWKRRVKGRWKAWRLDYVRWRHGYGPDELRAALQRLGVRGGDVLLVHSSLDRMEAFTGKTTQIITVLQELVGPSGLLLMPTLPFSGTALEWARSQVVFDTRKTPSRSGLLTELFRRSPGVLRSVHPTHSVAIWGSRAAAFVRDHPTCQTPCGKGSPYAGLLPAEGKILFLGAGIESMTFFHCVEEMLEERLPISPFTEERYRLQSLTATGEVVTTTTRLFNPDLSRRRRIAYMIPMLQSGQGMWRATRLGTADLLLLNARDIACVLEEMAARGGYCYDI